MLQALVDANGVPGMGASVWKDGRLIWNGSAGYRDMEKKLPVNEDTIFRLASVSKLITATAAARLQQDNKLDVDAKVGSLLPYLDNQWAPINSRQLAAHISGLPHYQAQDQNLGNVRYQNSEAAVSLFKDRELLSAPGSQYSYSSWGYTLLGAVIEQQSGQPFLDYVSKKITPGLKIGTDVTGQGNPNATIAYEFKDEKIRKAAPRDFSYTWGGGGLAATPAALATFGGRMLQNKIVSQQTFDWMLQPTKLNDGSDAAEEDYRVGFGWRVAKDIDGRIITHHAGITDGARSALVLWPEQKTAVSLLSNAIWVSSIAQSSMVLAAPFETMPDKLHKSACPIRSSRYQGKFGDRIMTGTANFSIVRGVCEGRLVLDKSMQDYFNDFLQKNTDSLKIIGIDASAGLARAALVTPIGLYDLRAQADGSHKARFSRNRNFELRYE